MSKQIAIIYDVRKRVLFGASATPEDAGFAVVSVGENQTIVVTCDGSFSWRVISADTIEESAQPASPAEPITESP